MRGLLARSLAGASAAIALAAGCGSDSTEAPSIAAGSSVVAPTTLPSGTPSAECGVRVMSWNPAREILVVRFATSVPAAVVLARATDSGKVTSSTSMTDIHGEGAAQLKVAREPVGRPVQVDISAAGGAKSCSTVFGVTSEPFGMHGGMP